MTSDFDPEITPEMKARYIERRNLDLTKLTRAVQVNDFDVISGIAHQIKGNAATFSFIDLEQIAIALESGASNESSHACANEIDRLRNWLLRHA